MPDDNILPVPPGSSPLRELCRVVHDALTLPRPATVRDELTYLRIRRDRSEAVLFAMKRLLKDREAGDRDVMAMVVSLRARIEAIPDDQYGHHPEPS